MSEPRVDRVIAGRRVGVRRPLAPGAGTSAGTGSVLADHRPALFLNGACLTSGGWKRVARLLPDRTLITVDRPGYRGTPLAEFPTLHAEVRALATILDTLAADGALGAVAPEPRAPAEHSVFPARCARRGLHTPGEGTQGTRPPHTTSRTPVTVVAHSMAAFQAEALARLRPELVGGVVLVDPSLVGPAARKPLAAKTAWQVARAAIGLRPAEGMARAAFRHGLRTQTQRGDLRDEEWEAAWSSAQALAAGAGEWLSYRGQLRELWELRQRQRGAGQAPSTAADRQHGSATPSPTTHYEAGLPGPGEPHSGRHATASAHKAPGSPVPAPAPAPVPTSPVPAPAPSSPVPAPVPAIMLEAPPYARERDLACLREAFASLTVVRLPRSRHLMMLDEPAAIARAVRHLD